MTVSYSEPWHSRPATRKIIVVGVVALLAIAGVAIAATVASWEPAPARTTSAREAATIEPAPGPTAATLAPTTFTIGKFSGAPGAPITVPILVTEAHGLGGASVRLAYDPTVVKVVAVANGDLAGSTLTWRHDAVHGALAMLLTTSVKDGIDGAGTYALVTLEAVADAMGTSTPLTLTVASAATAEREVVATEVASGTFRNGLTGDVNGDGVVARADYDALSRWLVGEDIAILKLNADLDGDGAITDVDALMLHQQLDARRSA